ncbi:hypothetical protein COCSADRAFT_246634 [Bipolaris sorokiniana ND90Pr]|uniref:Uncharacterized protein n=1 Tax=Cochliobolus sativus (strain ND90Pr / ATCC 201652) TaxID=665912 RepID=M2QXV8_COCSN|nr:uncharacterized protein COCSADRAFT_246634 [Bipolaris sorokiniana ND90Pr]EMD59904.1 hypothetical protein COCSADRAFT_246634 [Bipolaris sorokiniana ND90Pr]
MCVYTRYPHYPHLSHLAHLAHPTSSHLRCPLRPSALLRQTHTHTHTHLTNTLLTSVCLPSLFLSFSFFPDPYPGLSKQAGSPRTHTRTHARLAFHTSETLAPTRDRCVWRDETSGDFSGISIGISAIQHSFCGFR